MLNSTEQFTAAARTQLESQLHLATSVSDSLIDGMEKMMGLNLQAAKASLEHSIGQTQQLLSAKVAQDFFNPSAPQAQAEIIMTYVRHLTNIGSVKQNELAEVAENRINESSRQMVAMLDDMSKLSPVAEPAISAMKSAIDNANSGFAQLTRSTKLAMETMEANMSAAGEQMTSASGKARGKKA